MSVADEGTLRIGKRALTLRVRTETAAVIRRVQREPDLRERAGKTQGHGVTNAAIDDGRLLPLAGRNGDDSACPAPSQAHARTARTASQPPASRARHSEKQALLTSQGINYVG